MNVIICHYCHRQTYANSEIETCLGCGAPLNLFSNQLAQPTQGDYRGRFAVAVPGGAASCSTLFYSLGYGASGGY